MGVDSLSEGIVGSGNYFLNRLILRFLLRLFCVHVSDVVTVDVRRTCIRHCVLLSAVR